MYGVHNGDLGISYYPETDSLYIHLSGRSGADAVHVSEDVSVDVDADGVPVGIGIEAGASSVADLSGVEVEGLEIGRGTLSEEEAGEIALRLVRHARAEAPQREGPLFPTPTPEEVRGRRERRNRHERIVTPASGGVSPGAGGGPVFAGTDVPVRDFIDSLKEGAPMNDFTGHLYTPVTREQTVALLEWALKAAREATAWEAGWAEAWSGTSRSR